MYTKIWGHDFDLQQLESPTRNFKIPTKFWDPKRILADYLQIPGPYGFKWPSAQEAYNYFHPNKKYAENTGH